MEGDVSFIASIGGKPGKSPKFKRPIVQTLSYLFGFAVRVLVPLLAPKSWIGTLYNRVELFTPVNGFKNVLEAVYLYQRGSPHEGLAYPSPILAALLSPLIHFSRDGTLEWVSQVSMAVMWAAFDTLLAAALARFTRREWIGHAYLWNPISIVTAAGHSTVSLIWLLTIASWNRAREGRLLQASISISLASVLGVYPIVFVLPICKFLKMSSATPLMLSGGFIGVLTAVLVLSVKFITHSTSVWEALLLIGGTRIRYSDLHPNLGLWWYMFVEVFDHFRTLFIGMFQLQLFIHIVPLDLRFPSDPAFNSLILTGILASFGPYPSAGDVVVFLTLAMGFSRLFRNLRYPYLISAAYVAAATLTPLFYNLWVVRGDGNANFFYALNLVLGMANCFFLMDLVFARRKEDLEKICDRRLGDVVFSG